MSAGFKWRVRWHPERCEWRAIWRKNAATVGPFEWRPYSYRDCAQCGRAALMSFSTRHCDKCGRERVLGRIRLSSPAHAKVHKAIRLGELAVLDGSIACVDCGKPAEFYDHRRYSEPLNVEPVCPGCNVRRGPAIDAEPSLRKRRLLPAA